jgi:hypothetical protein
VNPLAKVAAGFAVGGVVVAGMVEGAEMARCTPPYPLKIEHQNETDSTPIRSFLDNTPAARTSAMASQVPSILPAHWKVHRLA